jgi:glycosyltransferase involved in cell wall biosynthesis
VVVPARNSERTLKKCLASLFEQDYPTGMIELIAVADSLLIKRVL